MSEVSSRARGGDKRASWLTFQRRLIVLRRLMRGPADLATLRAAAEAELGPDAYPGNAAVALRHDIGALRDEFGCAVRFRPGEGYTLTEVGFLALIDLPNTDLETLAFLSALFSSGTLPHASAVATLIEHLAALLPEERRAALQASRDQLEYPPTLVDSPPVVEATLRRTLGRQMLNFAYRSSYSGPHVVVLHRVAPVAFLHRDGHSYLHAYCHESDNTPRNKYHHYRIDRIVPDSLRVLPEALPRDMPRPKQAVIRYTLAPPVAHGRDNALWFGDSRVTFHDDGSAEILATTDNLWQARQYLLRYREHCIVHEPPELVAMMRESIERMAGLYSYLGASDESATLE